MTPMSTHGKIRVINRWVKDFAIERSAVGEYYAWVRFHKGIRTFYTDQLPSRDDLVDNAYSKIKLMIWQLMRDELY